MSTATLNTRLAAFRAWLERSSLGIPAQAVSLGTVPFQKAAILLPGETLEVPHASDPKRMRLITLTERAPADDAASLIPVMTGDDSPECSISASSAYSGCDAWYAANGRSDTAWESNGATTGWWRCRFAEPKAIQHYAMTTRDVFGDGGPRDWQFRGSNDGNAWEVLDEHGGVTWSNSERKDFYLQTQANFVYYDIFMTASNRPDYAAPLLLGEVQFYAAASERILVVSPQDYEIELMDNLTRVKRITPVSQVARMLTATVRL